jgi:hypothetical protein
MVPLRRRIIDLSPANASGKIPGNVKVYRKKFVGIEKWTVDTGRMTMTF